MSVSIVASGSRFVYAPTGGQLEIMYAVTYLSLPAEQMEDIVVLATTAIDTTTGVRIPQYQQAHPRIIGLSVMGVDVTMMGTHESPNRNSCWCKVTYGTPDFIPNTTLIEIQSLNGTTILNRWPYGPQAGQPIYVGANIDNGSGLIANVGGFDNQITTATVNASKNDRGIPNPLSGGNSTFSRLFDVVQIPVISGGIILRFTRRENTPPQIARYHRKISSTAWQGLAKGLWICRAVSAKNIVGVGSIFPGGGYEVTYDFQTAPELDLSLPSELSGFTHVEFFRDTNTGKPIPGVDCTDGSNSGYCIVTPYNSVNFNELGLPTVWDSLY